MPWWWVGALMLMGASLLGAGVALFGMGQAAAVLRARGGHMILATIGLVVGGLFVGLFIGLWAAMLTTALHFGGA